MSSTYNYYNANIVAKKIDGTSNDVAAVFEDVLQRPMLESTQTYQFTIERFSMEVPTFPVLKLKQNTDGSLPYAFNFQFGLFSGGQLQNYTGTYIQSQFVQRNFRTDSVNPMFVYNYQHFLDILNTTLSAMWTNFTNRHSLSATTYPPPFIEYDPSTNLFSFILAPALAFSDPSNDPSGNGQYFKLMVSQDIYNLFRNFNWTLNADNTATLNVNPNTTTSWFTDINGNKRLRVTQTHPSTGCVWSPVGTILFTSDILPLQSEAFGSPSILGSNIALGSSSSNNTENMITDLTLDLESSNDYNNNIVYTPSNHRWIDMTRSDEIRNIRFSVFWTDKINPAVRYPLLMPDNTTINLKVLFRKKSPLDL